MLKYFYMLPRLALLILISISISWFYFNFKTEPKSVDVYTPPQESPFAEKITDMPVVNTVIATPVKNILENNYHIFQSFNNCGPAALSMTLSYFGVKESQQKLGQDLRPYQNPEGDNDDKSVTLQELAKKAEEYGFVSFHRPNGNPSLIKQFISIGVPVITRTWLKSDEDVGHFRVIKGYDDSKKEFIQDDSLQGKNLNYTYDEFDVLWKKFNYEYLVIVRKEDEQFAKSILGNNYDSDSSWEIALENAKKTLDDNPQDKYARFNLSVAYFHTGDYQSAVDEYEKVADQLPARTLWYQIEPILAYYELEDYEKVFSITENILNNHNRAFSELYILRGDIHKKQGNIQAAREEYEKAVFYNTSLDTAREKLQETI